MDRNGLTLENLAVPIVASVVVHLVLAVAMPISAAVDIGVFRKEVARRFHIVSIQRVKKTQLTEQKTYRVVTVDPAELVRLFSDVLHQPDMSGPEADIIAASEAAALGVEEMTGSVADVNVGGRGLSDWVVNAAMKVGAAAGQFDLPSVKPKRVKREEFRAEFDESLAESVEQHVSPPDKFEVGSTTVAAELLVTRPAPGAPPPLVSQEMPPGALRPSFGAEKQPLAPGDIQPVAVGCGEPADLGAAIAAYGLPDDPNLFFRLMITGRDSKELKPLSKDVLFAVDVSGSMSPEKVMEARLAVQKYLPQLGQEDRFNVVIFGESVHKAFEGFVPPVPENIGRAVEFIQKLPSEPRADVSRAVKLICESLPASDRPCNVFLVSDGRGTQEAADARSILTILAEALPPNVSIFTFDSGAKSNRYLLDLLAWVGRGRALWVQDVAGSHEALLRLAQMHDRPLLTSLNVVYANLDPEETYPRNPPCLYSDQPIVLYGRSRTDSNIALQLAGIGHGGRRTYFQNVVLPEPDPRNSHIAQGWARGKIHFLVAHMAKHGDDKAIVQQIRDLGKAFAVPTPYAD